MSLLLISDVHLNSETSERSDSFLDLLESAWKNQDEVIIAGDLFDLWFGWSGMTFDFQEDILRQMEILSRKGLRMEYVEGNRDFGITELKGRVFKDVSTNMLQRFYEGRSIYVEHGDLVNRHDRPYRLWHAFVKNPLSFFLLRCLPGKLALKLATAMEERLRQTNLRHKSYYPEESCRSFSRERFLRGADIVILGHFHVEKEEQFRVGDRDVLFFNLPGWEHGLRYLVIPPGKQKPYFSKWG